MRAVLDPNVLISAVLSPRGAPARIIRLWRAALFELVISESVLSELERTTARRKLQSRLSETDVTDLVSSLRADALLVEDPPLTERRSDDHLIALASAERAVLVSGDHHLLELADRFPILSPRDFLSELE